ncbi:hypothetical protein FNH06_20115 [Amycolatopsis acidiphila]|uniref:Uncharacterized protein n=1 Tax=Amycolatopsis acidiphila TaxID=715473 RepID=A0A558A8R7_9PSEU|nr:hypothetical protein FNH06_20115 [Amycolatopsis acidiphila]
MPSNEVNSRRGDDGEQLTVAELLRREGVTQELPVVKDPVDDAPTERIPVVELLRREGRWNKRKASKVGALAAGVAALAGVAVTALSAGQLHDTAASAGGGAGGPYIPPEAKTSQLGSPPSLASSETTTPDGTSIGQVATRQVAADGTSSADRTQSATGESSGAQARSGSAGQAPVAAQPTQDSTTTGSSTTTRSEPPTGSTTTQPHQPAAHTSTPTTPTEQPKGGGLLGSVVGLLGGILGG